MGQRDTNKWEHVDGKEEMRNRKGNRKETKHVGSSERYKTGNLPAEKRGLHHGKKGEKSGVASQNALTAAGDKGVGTAMCMLPRVERKCDSQERRRGELKKAIGGVQVPVRQRKEQRNKDGLLVLRQR